MDARFPKRIICKSKYLRILLNGGEAVSYNPRPEVSSLPFPASRNWLKGWFLERLSAFPTAKLTGCLHALWLESAPGGCLHSRPSSAFSPEENWANSIAFKHLVDVCISRSLQTGIGFFHLLSPAFPTARARPAPKGGTAGLLRSAQENTSPLGPLCLPAGNSVRGGAPLRAPLRPALPVLGQA